LFPDIAYTCLIKAGDLIVEITAEVSIEESTLTCSVDNLQPIQSDCHLVSFTDSYGNTFGLQVKMLSMQTETDVRRTSSEICILNSAELGEKQVFPQNFPYS